jgi:hypothetical protein
VVLFPEEKAMNKRWLYALAVAGIGYWLWKKSQAGPAGAGRAKITFKSPVPASAVPTGKDVVTMNGRSPDYPQDAVGYGQRRWIEMMTPDGKLSWVEAAL